MARHPSSADFQVCCVAGVPTRRLPDCGRSTDLEVGDTAGLETCATKAGGPCLEKSSRVVTILTDSTAKARRKPDRMNRMNRMEKDVMSALCAEIRVHPRIAAWPPRGFTPCPFHRRRGACCPNRTGARVSHPQQPGLPTSARNSTSFGPSNMLRLRQPRSAVSKMIWATCP